MLSNGQVRRSLAGKMLSPWVLPFDTLESKDSTSGGV
jgi:hypothetical protein